MNAIDIVQNNKKTLVLLKGNSHSFMNDLCRSSLKKGIGIVTASTSGTQLLSKFQEENIDCSKTFIIDCISLKGPSSLQIVYTKGPSALTDLGHSISQLVKSKAIKLIIIDSVSSFLIHNTDIILVRFLHEIVSKISQTDKKLVITMLKKDNKGTLASVPIFMDAVVEV